VIVCDKFVMNKSGLCVQYSKYNLLL